MYSKVKNFLKVGDALHGYKLEQVDYIKELNIRPYYLRHQLTGAEHLHVAKDGDSNNVFSVSLRTTPKNSTGVAHILEHLALCGSKKYAVRDPFFKMTTRSLATFMNAMTGPDFTTYPFSTQNKKDFENLLNVYMDAVFFPRLRSVDFRQEGWRLEHEKPDKKDTPVVIKGVVYNEMKGVFSSSSSIYCRQLLNNLFPDTTYQYESGGDPEVIPHLTHEELRKFHQLHYHPTNARFFTYGDLPLEDHLELIDKIVLSKFSEEPRTREDSFINPQPVWLQPKTVNISCPFDPVSAHPDKQTTTSVSYMLPTTTTTYEEMFALQILSSLLIDTPNAPFYKSLIESGLGSDYCPSTGLGTYTKQPFFSVGLQNIHKESVNQVHDIINKTFEEVKNTGFASERVDAILHNVELSLKHVRGNFGLGLLMNLECSWNHGGDPLEFLRVNKHMTQFKNSLEGDKNYWAKLIDKYFLSNSHKLILNMNPDQRYGDIRAEKEKNLIESKVAKLSDVDLQTVLYEGMELMKIQNSKGDPSVLPCLDPSVDISRELPNKCELLTETYKDVNIQVCEQPTNEVVYFRALSNIGKLQEEGLVDYLPLFCDVATKLGAGKYNRHELSQQAQLTTGGLSLALLINPSLEELDRFRSEVMLQSHCLRRNVHHMFDLWHNVFDQIHFQTNKDYLYQLIKSCAADLADGIPQMGQMYAVKRSSSQIANIGALDERLSGLTFIARMKDIASHESVDSVSEKLQSIGNVVLNPHNLRCSINSEPEVTKSTMDTLKQFIESTQGSYESHEEKCFSDTAYEKTKVEDMKFPFATHYVAKSYVTVPRLHKDFPKLVIMSKLISSRFLLKEVREKGGAYGAGLRLSNSGILSFSSYRDPHTEKTLDTFSRALDWISSGEEYTDRDIEESKLGVFQDVDRPVEPGKRGLNAFLSGETDAMRQEYRNRLLKVSRKDLIHVAEKYLNQDKHGFYVI